MESPSVGARTRARWVGRTRAELASAQAMSDLARRFEQQVPDAARLVRALHRAAEDERRHARLCEQVLQRLGEPWEPEAKAPPIVPPTESGAVDVGLVEQVVYMLCSGEAIAAAMLRRAGAGASEPQVVELLADIARDEARHGALGWAVLDALLPTLSLRARLEAARLAPKQAMRAVVAAARAGPVDEDAAAWGVLTPEQAMQVAREVLRTEVGPKLQQRGLWDMPSG